MDGIFGCKLGFSDENNERFRSLSMDYSIRVQTKNISLVLETGQKVLGREGVGHQFLNPFNFQLPL